MNRIRAMGLAMAATLVSLAGPPALAAASAQQDYADAMSATPDTERGAQLFSACATCHGADGGGKADGVVPRLAGQHARVIIRQLVDYRYDKRRDPRMEPVAHTQSLRDAQGIADVAAFAAALPARAPAGKGSGAFVDAARQVYAARCAGCHGMEGQGEPAIPVPRLAGQHYAYLLRQFHDALEGRRPALAESHATLLQDLDRDALQGLADMLARQGAAVR
jgi:cytochrome c553